MAEQGKIEGMEELAAGAQAGGKAIALATQPGQGGSQLIIDTDLWRFATGLVQGGMVPKGLNAHPGAVVAIIQAGAEIGFPPMHSLTALTFINGRLGIMGEASRGLVRARGKLKEGTLIKLDLSHGGSLPEKLSDWPGDVAGIATCWPKGAIEPAMYRFSVDDARRAGLWNPAKAESPWRRYPDRMLMNRAWGFMFRDHFSETFAGLWTAEELRDIDPVSAAREVSPATAPAPIGPGPGEKDPALEVQVEVTPPPEAPAEPEEPQKSEPAFAPAPPGEPIAMAGPEPPAATEGIHPDYCTHPDGFARTIDRQEPHCIHCGAAPPAQPQQQELTGDTS